MTKEFKKGDKVYYINPETSEPQLRIIESVEGGKTWVVTGGWMPTDRVFHLDETVVDNPFKNIKTPIYTLDTIAGACFDYMTLCGVEKASDSFIRRHSYKGVVYLPTLHSINPYLFKEVIAKNGWTKLSKEDFYNAIGFIESDNEIIESSNMPLFGSELINKYRK